MAEKQGITAPSGLGVRSPGSDGGGTGPGRPRLVKLVRDRVGEFLGGDSTASYEPIPAEGVVPALRAKLLEEVGEYLTDPCLGELADVFEVVRAIADAEGFGLRAVMKEADAKAWERGGFYGGIGMYVTTTAPARHEGGHAA